MIQEQEIEKDLTYSKSGKTALITRTKRICLVDNRYGVSDSVVNNYGEFTRVFYNNYKYTSISRIASIDKNSFYINAKHNIDGSEVEIYKVKDINTKDKKILLEKVASFENNRWSNTEYLKTLKRAIKSTLMKAKKFYNLSDIQ